MQDVLVTRIVLLRKLVLTEVARTRANLQNAERMPFVKQLDTNRYLKEYYISNEEFGN